MLHVVANATRTLTSNPLPASNFLTFPPRPLKIGDTASPSGQSANAVALIDNSEQLQRTDRSTILVPSKNEGSAWFGQKIMESVIYSIGDYVLVIIGVFAFSRWLRRRDSLRRFHDQISIEIPGFCNPSAKNHPAIYYKQFEPEDLTEILDRSANALVKKAIKGSKKDLLPFVIFKHVSKKSPYDIIGRSVRQWAESFLGESAIDISAPKNRLQNGIMSKNSADIIQYFAFFTCDELGSTEQLCVVPIQAEELLNILTDLPNWWNSTEQESKLEERDSKIRLARIVEFAVALATRYPLALKDCLSQYDDKVLQAIKNAGRLEKILAVLPKETVQWLNDFIDAGYLTNNDSLPAKYRLSEAEKTEVMRDWFCVRDEKKCRELAEIEKAATSFDALMDTGVKHKIPMWFIMPRKYIVSEERNIQPC